MRAGETESTDIHGVTPPLPLFLGMARFVVGVAVFLFPRHAGRAFAGAAGRTAAVSIFARGFGARDAAIGAGLWSAAARGDGTSPWLAAAAVADAGDALGVLLTFRRLPRLHRWVALLASLTPMVIEIWALANRGFPARAGTGSLS